MYKYLAVLTTLFLACGNGIINPSPSSLQAQKQASPETATGQPKLELAFDLNFRDITDRVFPFLYFDRIFAGETYTRTALVTNGGTDVLMVNISGLNEVFTADPSTAVSVNPGESTEMSIRFAPASEGSYEIDVTFTSNDPRRTTQRVRLFGSAIRRPPEFVRLESSVSDGGTAPINQPINFSVEARGADKIVWSIRDLTESDFAEFVLKGEGEEFTFTPDHRGTFEVKVMISGKGGRMAKIWVIGID